MGTTGKKGLDLDKAFREFQRILKRHPVLVVGTGVSCALDPRFGMPELAKELAGKIQPDRGPEKRRWEKVKKDLEAQKGLEEALGGVSEENGLVDRIIAATGAFVASVDHNYAWQPDPHRTTFPLEGLLRRLVDGLPPTNPIQHIVTPNYDMIIEHTCDSMGIPFTDGFTVGSTCRRDWNLAGNSMLMLSRESRGRTWTDVTRVKRHVRLYKVHGSINWFVDEQGTLLRCDRLTDGRLPAGCRRAIITPGRSKFAEAGRRRDWFSQADDAIARADAFLIVGYGLNDDHIQGRIKTKLTKQNCPGVIVTRDFSRRIEEWVRQSSDLWAVCRRANSGRSGSIIIGPGNVDSPLVCEGLDLWEIAAFTAAVM